MAKTKFHHIGVACRNIERELKYFEILGYKPVSDVFIDNEQKIRGLFISSDGQPQLELLENISDDGPLTAYLDKGTKFYHFAYETDDIEQSVREFVTNGAIVVKPIVDAVYFRRVCFLMLKNMMLVELVEINNKKEQ